MKTPTFLLLPLLALCAACDPADDDPTSGGDDDPTSGDPPAAADCPDGDVLPSRVEDALEVGPGCVILEQTEVKNGGTLTIAAGTTVVVREGGFLDIGIDSGQTALLVAQGTVDEPIVFTSAAQDPAPGDWGCIGLGDGDSALSNVSIHYGGDACGVDGHAHTSALVIAGQIHSAAGIEVTDSAGHGLEMTAEANVLKQADYSFARNALASVFTNQRAINQIDTSEFLDEGDYIHVDATTRSLSRSGDIWRQPVPYRIDGNFEIDPDTTVDLQPGTTLEMTAGSGIEVQDSAIFRAVGTAAEPVTFTSAEDSPAAGDWGCIWMGHGTATLELRDTVIEYAGSGDCSGADVETAIFWAPEGAVIEDNVFRNINGDAITGDFAFCDAAWCANTFESVSGVDVACPGSDPESLSC